MISNSTHPNVKKEDDSFQAPVVVADDSVKQEHMSMDQESNICLSLVTSNTGTDEDETNVKFSSFDNSSVPHMVDNSMLSSECHHYDTQVGTVNRLHCSYRHDSPDNAFSQNPTKSVVAFKMHCGVAETERDITFFCVKETCDYSTTVCNAYEKHLMGCLNILNERLSDALKEKLHSSIEFVLEFHNRHDLETSLEFKDFVSSFSNLHDSRFTSLSDHMKETHLDTGVNSCASISQNLIETKSESCNCSYHQVHKLEKEENADEVMEMKGPVHLNFTASIKKENVIVNSPVDYLISENPDLENDIADDSSLKSDFFSKEATNDTMKSEEISHSEIDTIAQNTHPTTTPRLSKSKRLNESTCDTKDNQKEDTRSRMKKPKPSKTTGTRSVRSNPSTTGFWSTQSVKHLSDLNGVQKDTACWECFRKSVFSLDTRYSTLCPSAVKLETQKSNETMTSNISDDEDQKEMFVKQSARASRRNIHKVGCKDRDVLTNHHGNDQNSVPTAPLNDMDKIANTSDTHQGASLECWLCFQDFSQRLEMKSHILREHPETLYALIEDLTVQTALPLFCPKDCEYKALKEDDLTHHMATCQGQVFERSKEDRLNICNLISQEHIELKHKVSSQGIFDKIKRRRTSPPDSQNTYQHQQDISYTEDHNDIDDDMNNDSNDTFIGNNNAEDLVPSLHQNVKTRVKNSNAKDLVPSSHQSVKTRGKNSNAKDLVPSSLQSVNTRGKNNNVKNLTPLGYHYYQDGLARGQSDNASASEKLLIDNYSCHLCNLAYSSKALLKSHSQTLHCRHWPFVRRKSCLLKTPLNVDKAKMSPLKGDDHVGVPTHKKKQTTKQNGKMTYKYKCKECGKTFDRDSRLQKHVKIHEGLKLNIFKCNTCSKTFRCKSWLRAHMRTHTGETPFICEKCGQTYKHKGDLNVHMKIHTGEKPFKCEHCDWIFRKKDSLNAHMKIHTGEKPFECEQCGQTFRKKDTLNGHMRLHSGEKPFKCEQCGRTFRLRCTFKSHMRIHTGEKPFKKFKCKQCGRIFTEKGMLKDHMKIHTGEKPFKCKQCGQTFKRRGNFNAHIKKHTGENDKPFKCKYCYETFKYKCYLNAHMRKHTGEKSFKCEQCGQTFRQKSQLKVHMRIHTAGKPFKCK